MNRLYLIVLLLCTASVADAAYIPPYAPPAMMGAPDLTGLALPIIPPIDPFHFLNETWAVESPDGHTVLVAANDAVLGGISGGFISVTVRVETSTDGGKTFPTNMNLSDLAIIAGFGLYYASDPSVTVDAAGTYYAGGAMLSVAGGGTCTPPPKNFFGVTSSADGVHWAPLRAIAPPTAAYLSDRPMLVGGKYLWASWNAFSNLCNTGSPHVAVSYDKGVTWHDHTIRVDTDYQPDLNFVVVGDSGSGAGTALLPIMLTDHLEVHSCGASVRCTLLASIPAHPTPDEQFRLSDMGMAERINSMPSIAADETGLKLLVAWMQFTAPDSTEIVDVRSTDGGLTWSVPEIASNTTTEQFFPMTRYDDDTPSLCFYEAPERGTRNYDVRCGELSPDGWVWSVVSPAGSIDDAPGPNGNFVGDYIGRTRKQIAAVAYRPNANSKYQPFIEMLTYPGSGCEVGPPSQPGLASLLWFVPFMLVARRRRMLLVGMLALMLAAPAGAVIIPGGPTCTVINGQLCCQSTFSAVCETPPPIACVGDCNGDGEVTVDELLTGVAGALADDASACPAVACVPPHWEGGTLPAVPVACLMAGVRNAMEGCP